MHATPDTPSSKARIHQTHSGCGYSFGVWFGGVKGFEDDCRGIPPFAPFILKGTLSRLGSRARPSEDLWISCCLFGPLGGSSSSSLLRVRSTTWPADRLLLDGGNGAEEVDCSLDEIGGVRMSPGSRETSVFTEASRGRSRISTKSSSPSLLVRPLLVLGDGARPPVWDHVPSGSIVIWSTDFGVDFKMSATYLQIWVSQALLYSANRSLTDRLEDAHKQRLYYRQGRSTLGLVLGVEGKRRRRNIDYDCKPMNGRAHRSSVSTMGTSMTLLRTSLRFRRLPICWSLEIDSEYWQSMFDVETTYSHVQLVLSLWISRTWVSQLALPQHDV